MVLYKCVLHLLARKPSGLELAPGTVKQPDDKVVLRLRPLRYFNEGHYPL